MPRRRVDVSGYDRDRKGKQEHVRDYVQERDVHADQSDPSMLRLRRDPVPVSEFGHDPEDPLEGVAEMPPPGHQENPRVERVSMYDTIRPGSRVTILVPAGKRYDYRTGQIEQEWAEKQGRAVMLGPAGWVINLGGRYGTPGIATPENVVRVRG